MLKPNKTKVDDLDKRYEGRLEELNSVPFIKCDIDKQGIYDRLYSAEATGNPNAPSIDSVFNNITYKDRYVPLGSVEAENLVTALEITADSYENVNFPHLHQEVINLAKPKPDFGGETGFSMAELKDMLSNSKALSVARHKETGMPAQEHFYEQTARRIRSVDVLKGNTKEPDINLLDLGASVELASRDVDNTVKMIEADKHNFYQNLKELYLEASTNPEYADTLDKLPKPAKYLRDFATPNDEVGLMQNYESFFPAVKGATQASHTKKSFPQEQYPDVESKKMLEIISDFYIEEANKLKNSASFNRESSYASALKRPYDKLNKPAGEILDGIKNGDYDLSADFTKTMAHIQMYKVQQPWATPKENSAYTHNLSKPKFHGSASLPDDVSSELDKGIVADGSIVLRTGIDGKQNPTYSENPNGSENAFAIMSAKKPVNASGATAICVSKDPLDAVAFSTALDENRYNQVLYTTPENVTNVIKDLNDLNSNRTFDVIGDLRPNEQLEPIKDGSAEFSETTEAGYELAKKLEMHGLNSNLDIKVLLPVVSRPHQDDLAFTSWSAIRESIEMGVKQNNLPRSDVNNAFATTVNGSIAQSVDRRSKLKEILAQAVPDNTKALIQEERAKLEMDSELEYERTIRNKPSISPVRR